MNQYNIRPALPADTNAIFSLIQELAVYEKLMHQVTGTPDNLSEHLFGEAPYAEALKRYFPMQADAIDQYLHIVRAVSKSPARALATMSLI